MHFDLTTNDGRKRVLETFDKYGWIISPSIWLLKMAYDLVSSPSTIEAQKKSAIDLIKAGRDNNVEEMTITIEQSAGIDIGADVEGISIKTKIGKSGKMTLEVKYK